MINESNDGVDIALVNPLNLNDPEQLAAALNEMAEGLIACDNPSLQKDGVWLKALSSGFVAAIATAKESNWPVGDQIDACVTSFATLLGLMVGAGSKDPEDCITNMAAVGLEFTKSFSRMVANNIANAEKCNSDGSATPRKLH